MVSYVQTLMDPIATGPNTPQGVKTSREYAAALLKGSQEPVAHWAQGLGNIVKALQGGYTDYKANEQEVAGQRGSMERLIAALGVNQPTPQAPMNMPNPAVQSPTGAQFAVPPQANPMFAQDSISTSEAPAAPMANQPRGLRNNNPGNIEDGPFARQLPGYVGNDGRFAKFASLDDGNAAMERLLQSYGQRGFNTPESIINRWAPPSDNNPTQAYAGNVAKALGVQPNAALDMNNPAIRQQIMKAITLQENGPSVNPMSPQGVAPLTANSAANPASAGVVPQGATPQINRQALLQILTDPWASEASKAMILKQLGPRDPIKLGEGDNLYDPRTYQPLTNNKKEVKPIEVNTGTHIELRHPNTGAVIQRIPIDIAGKKKQEITAETQAKAEGNLPKAEAQATSALDLIQQIRNHPGKAGAVGWQGDLPTWPGSKQRDFEVLLKQAQGQTFLQAIESLRGSGQITEIEGQKAQEAIARLQRAQSAPAFNKALDDFEATIKKAIQVQRTSAGVQPPDAAAATPNVRTYNPATGQLE